MWVSMCGRGCRSVSALARELHISVGGGSQMKRPRTYKDRKWLEGWRSVVNKPLSTEGGRKWARKRLCHLYDKKVLWASERGELDAILAAHGA